MAMGMGEVGGSEVKAAPLHSPPHTPTLPEEAMGKRTGEGDDILVLIFQGWVGALVCSPKRPHLLAAGQRYLQAGAGCQAGRRA